MGTVGSAVNALANEYLKELATVDEPVETVSVLWLLCYMKEGANSSCAKVEGLGLEFRRSRVFVDERTDQCKAESSSRRDRDRPYNGMDCAAKKTFVRIPASFALRDAVCCVQFFFSMSRWSGLLRALQRDEACAADEQERPAEPRRRGYETSPDN